MGSLVATTSLSDFFAPRVHDCLADLDLSDLEAADYLTALLVRFTAADELAPPLRDGGRLESLSEHLGAVQRAWQLGTGHFDPASELELRHHLGDHALFMAGFFWERVRGATARRHYVRTGRWAYRFLAAHHRAAGLPQARLFRVLADGFDRYAGALTYLREIYLEGDFAPWPHPSFVRVMRWD